MSIRQEQDEYDRHVAEHRCEGKPCARRSALWRSWMGEDKK